MKSRSIQARSSNNIGWIKTAYCTNGTLDIGSLMRENREKRLGQHDGSLDMLWFVSGSVFRSLTEKRRLI